MTTGLRKIIVAGLAVLIVAGLAVLAVAGLIVFQWWYFSNDWLAASGDVTSYPDTAMVAHPDVPLDPKKNMIWCGVMALAWNEAIRKAGGELHFVDPLPEADELNRGEFTKDDLDEESYFVVADKENHHVSDQIRDGMREKFGMSIESRLLPDDSAQDPEKFTAFACLRKNLDFPVPYHNNIPMMFGAKRVANFGFGLKLDPSQHDDDPNNFLNSQVSVLSYISDDNFVIQLETKGDKDQLVLAKIPPGKTLQATIDSVLPLLKTRASEVRDQDTLAVPKVDFDLMSNFKELEGKRLTSGGQMDKITEDVRFQLNEYGARLSVLTEMGAELAYDDHPPPPRHFVFDKPFLILLEKCSSSRPYFALWVGNSTLLVSE